MKSNLPRSPSSILSVLHNSHPFGDPVAQGPATPGVFSGGHCMYNIIVLEILLLTIQVYFRFYSLLMSSSSIVISNCDFIKLH